MARIPYLEPDDLEPEDRKLLDRPINLAKALVHTPGGARAFMRFGSWIRFQSTLDPRLREMAILRVGVLARNEYEYSHHVKIGFDFGLTESDVEGVLAGPDFPGFSELERLVVMAADEATVDGSVAESTFAALREHLGTEKTVELTMMIGFYNGVVRILSSLGVDVEDDYQQYLERHPLPDTP